MKNLSHEELYFKKTGEKATYRKDSSDYHTLHYVRWLEFRLNRLAELEKYRETCKENEIPCGNKDCEFLSKIFDQSCGAENQGETALIECKRYMPSVDNIITQNAEPMNRIAEAEKQLKERELISICVYCGTKLISKSTDTKMNDVIEHMAECKKHPVPILLDKLAEIEKWFIQHGEHTLEIWNGYVKLHNEGMFTLVGNPTT